MRSASKRLRLNSVGLQQQQLSYRKQIARQLRTQHVERICNNPVTLKYRLRSLETSPGQNVTRQMPPDKMPREKALLGQNATNE